MVQKHFLTVSSTAKGSIARKLGFEKGDMIVRINNHPVSDIIDYHLLTCEKALSVEVIKHSGENWVTDIEKDEYETLGLSFEEDIPGGIRHCCNKCVFCFIDQLPSGLRDTLYVRDDDYRHSFLYGNYVSLTNLSPADWERIKRMRLSPLYVSVHSTNPKLRGKLFGNPRAENIMHHLKELADVGITVHTQIVVCPGMNDKDELNRTLTDLASLWPAISSVSVVPVGVTKYQKFVDSMFSPVDKASAIDLIARVDRMQSKCNETFGHRLVFAADELFLKADIKIPLSEYYEDFPQLENGVGMVRLFMDELSMLLEELPNKVESRNTVIVCGTSASGIISEAAQSLNERVKGVNATVLTVGNTFFGSSVTVTGLLTGQDIARALGEHFPHRKKDNTTVILSEVTLKADADIFLDGYTVEDIEAQTGVKITVVENSARGLVQGVLGLEVF